MCQDFITFFIIRMYSIITYDDPKEAEPVDDEVEDELQRINQKKNEENNI